MPVFNLCLALVLLLAPLTTGTPPSPSSSAPEGAEKAAPLKAAILIYEGVQIIDYTGPFEVLGEAYANDGMVFDVFTVSERPGPLTTNMGMTVTPKYSFGDCPSPDVIVVPGGNVPDENPAYVSWLRSHAESARIVMSVCNGAFLLAKAGLLDGNSATTYYNMIDNLRAAAPKCNVVRDRRFVDNGKIITTAGLSSGIDGALHVVERVAGFGTAQAVALNMEYDWRPDSTYARGSFADRYLRKALGRTGFDLPEGTNWTVLGQTGDATSWEKRWEVRSQMSPVDLMRIVDACLDKSWTRAESPRATEGAASAWTFRGDGDEPWSAVASVVAPERGVLRLTVALSRSR